MQELTDITIHYVDAVVEQYPAGIVHLTNDKRIARIDVRLTDDKRVGTIPGERIHKVYGTPAG